MQEDYYKSIRTNVLLAWTLSNALLAAIIITATGKTQDQGAQNSVKGYMAFLLFSVAGLACAYSSSPDLAIGVDIDISVVIRFVGSTMYMIVRLFAGE